MTGVYSQGELLNERKLAEALGISRTPIREALQMLNIDGWVVDEPFKGSVVRTFDLEYVMNVQKVRMALEALAAEDAAANVSSEDIGALEEIIARQEELLQAYDPGIFMKLDRELHEKIYSFSKNDVLLKLLNNLNDIIRFFGIKVLAVPERSVFTLQEHRNIIQAIKDRNLEQAKRAMETHMNMTTNAIYQFAVAEDKSQDHPYKGRTELSQ